MTDFDLPRNTAIVTDEYITINIELINESLDSFGLIVSALAKKYPHNEIFYIFTVDENRKKIIVILAKNKIERVTYK